MSEHRAAAHITGIYAVLAAVAGAVAGWYLRPALDPPGQPSISRLDPKNNYPLPATSLTAPEDSDRKTSKPFDSESTIDLGELLSQSEPKQEHAVLSEVTMQAYYRLLDDEGVPQLDVAKQYIGKRVHWVGYFFSLDIQESAAQRYRIVMVCDPKDFDDYLYFYLPEEVEEVVAKLRNGSKVVVSGVLSGRTTLSDAKIESVENMPQ